jgi:UbiD family decarboxylase
MDARGLVATLEAAGELTRVTEPVHLNAVAGLFAASDRALLFERPAGSGFPLIGNLAATRSRLALGADVSPRALFRLGERLRRPRALETVADPPCQEVVRLGDAVDLTELPWYLQHEKDGAPYLSNAVDVARNPQTGGHNVGMRRLMFEGRRQTGIHLAAPSDLQRLYRRNLAQGEPTEVAFAFGLHPLCQLGALVRLKADEEYGHLAALSERPLRLTPARTVDLLVPADAEVVLEGRILADGYRYPEGPYGEFPGIYGEANLSPRVEITALTHRRDAIFQTTTISGRYPERTDSANLAAGAAEITFWETLTRAVTEPVALHVPPAGSQFVVIAAIRRHYTHDARAALLALLNGAAFKFAIVVDEDIDPTNWDEVAWALATRVQPARDVITLDRHRAVPLDPSLAMSEPPYYSSCLGIDATRKPELLHRYDVADVPFREAEESLETLLARGREWAAGDATSPADVAARIRDLQARGSVRYLDVLREFPAADYRAVLEAWESCQA